MARDGDQEAETLRCFKAGLCWSAIKTRRGSADPRLTAPVLLRPFVSRAEVQSDTQQCHSSAEKQ